MTDAQRKWMEAHPEFSRVGPPRPVQFLEWGTLNTDGTYERLDDKPRTPIRPFNGAIGVGRVAAEAGQ